MRRFAYRRRSPLRCLPVWKILFDDGIEPTDRVAVAGSHQVERIRVGLFQLPVFVRPFRAAPEPPWPRPAPLWI